MWQVRELQNSVGKNKQKLSYYFSFSERGEDFTEVWGLSSQKKKKKPINSICLVNICFIFTIKLFLESYFTRNGNKLKCPQRRL